MEKTLRLFTYVDGGINDTPFPSEEKQIEIGAFRYDAKRMGGAPIITATIMYSTCLDKVWNDMVYASLNGERYFLKQTPTSSKSNDDSRYKHDIELIAERTILDNTYFYDAVVGSPIENDVPITNSTKFHFYGHIEKFVDRMNASLQYTGIQKVDENGNVIGGYRVVLDNDVVKRDQKQVSFDSAVFSQALQEAYNTFGVPFYFDGKTIHVGFSNNIINDVLEYGVDGALLSATKTNANFKVVNRATGNGSSDNIPYYYPNNSPKGEIGLEVNTKSSNFNVKIVDTETFSNAIDLDGVLEYIVETKDAKDTNEETWKETFNFTSNEQKYSYSIHYGIKDVDHNRDKYLHISPIVDLSFYEGQWLTDGDENSYFDWISQELSKVNAIIRISVNDEEVYSEQYSPVKLPSIDLPLSKSYENIIRVKMTIDVFHELKEGEGYFYYDYCLYKGDIGLNYKMSFESESEEMWFYNDQEVDLGDLGLSYTGTPFVGDTITQRLVKRVNTSSTLQPSIYRATDGKERFYNAVNYPFAFVDGYELKYGEYVLDGEVHNDAYKKDDGTYYEFTNEYKEGRPREHVFSVDDIKPTIKEMTNHISWVERDEEGKNKTVFQRIDMFSEFAYNIGDNDETYTDPNNNTSFKHPYFFAKLRKLDFNLFDSASEMGEMTFSMTSGHCGACNFKLGVDKDGQFNPVQVYEEDTWEDGVFHKAGSLKYDKNGYVRCGLEDWQGKEWPQDRQQDTVNYEVWIALKKEDDTYGILMPKAPKYEGNTLVDAGHRPTACSSPTANDGDTFVILNINLPDEYVYRAEKKLEKAIVKYIWENNVEKFNFSVNFSRIFLEENSGEDGVATRLNENARLTNVRYNGKEYILYVSSYSYTMNEGEVLPEIRVELDDTLTISQNALQNAINEVKSDIANAINAIDVAAIGSRYFLRKDTYDVAEAPIGFKKGVIFGDNGMVEVNEDGTSKLTIDYLDVTRKATFTSLEIQEQSHVGGQILITPASMVCNGVEELEDAYRCYFETQGDGGEEIFNQFVEGDQAISQTFNEWGGHYYWRLVTGIGKDYIDLSKTDCAPESDIPKAGNKIIQLGNRSNIARQAAQVLSSYGEDSPSFIMYNGINSFSLDGKEVTGILWNPETQEPQMYSYGSFFFGDRKLDGNFITFQKKDGDTEKTLTINADVQLGGGSTGLSNLSEWKAQDEKVTQAATDASNANTAATEAKNTANTAIQRAQKAQADATQAKEDAEAAQSVANAASQRLNEWASDGIISPVEKQALKNELAVVNSDYDDIHKQYEKYIQEFDKFILTDGKYYVTEDGYIFNVEVANSNWSSFRSAYQSYVAELTLKTSTSESVEVGDLTAKMNAYYSARTAMLEDISLSIKAEADYSKKQANQAIQDASDARGIADTANASVTTLGTRIDGVDKTIAEINNKLDGVVESYFDDYIPSKDNLPASEWVANGTEADHIGDTFTNTALNGEGAGQSWRWLEQADGSYDWQQIADSDAAKALALAGQAKAAADGKTKTFLVTPTNYNIGDIWIVGDTIPEGFVFKKGDILTTSSDSVSYVANHWSKVINYNDEFQSTLDAKVGELNTAINNVEQIANDYTDDARIALQNSINALNEAKANIKDVYTKAESEGMISESEQRAIDAANDYAQKAQENAEINVKAWADGEIKQAEQDAINEANANLQQAKNELDEALRDLESEVEGVRTLANNAQAIASSATSKLNEWASDNVISPLEKEGLRTELAFILGDYNDIEKNYIKYIQEFDRLILSDGKQYITEDGYVFNVEVANTNWEAYENAYLAYKSDLESKTANNETTPIGTLKTTQSAYYNKRALVLEDITLSIKAEADYSKKTAQKASEDVENLQEKVKSDYDYLTEIFGKGNNLNVEGVVMSQMVAVKNDEDDVEAFLNGSIIGESDEHGKLILAGGIPSDDRNLDVRATEAKTRIYENGRVDTNDIHATGGTFKNVTVSGIFKNPFNDDGTFVSKSDNYVNLNSSPIRSITLPTDIEQSGRKVTFVGYFIITCGTNIIVEGKGTKLYEISNEITELVAVKMSASTVQWHVLRRMPYGLNECSTVRHSGMFAGLRPKIRTITTNDTVDELDHTILIDSKSSISITLPKNAQEGQVYEFLMLNQEGTTVKHPILSNTTDIHDPLGNQWLLNRLEIAGYGIGRFIRAKDGNGTLKWWFYRIR